MVRCWWIGAALLLTHALLTTALWPELGASFARDNLNYRARQLKFGFGGLPIDDLTAALDLSLGADRAQAIALSPRLQGNSFVVQRLAEGLYPRRIDQTAALRLDFEDEKGFSLAEKPLSFKAALAAPSRGEGRVGLFFVLSLIAIFGLGAVISIFLKRRSFGPIELAAAPLLAACYLAFRTSVATWVQVSFPFRISHFSGLAAFSAVALLLVRKAKGLSIKLFRPQPEAWVLAALLLFLFARLAFFPITLWDGRSIWLFHAKQVAQNGMLPAIDLTQADYLWSHPDYPLLYPAWIAFFMTAGGTISEHGGALGIGALTASLVLLLWSCARPALGRWPGAALTLALLLYCFRAIAGGYADPALCFLLLIEFFCFLPDGDETVGWAAALAGSLIKAEGLYLAGSLAVITLTTRSKNRQSSVSCRPRLKRLLPITCFLPALLHKGWCISLGTDSIFKGHDFSAALGLFPGRLAELVQKAPSLYGEDGYTGVRQILWSATIGLLVVVVLWGWRRSLPRTVALAIGVALFYVAFAFVSISMMPEPVSWFAQTAFDRLLLHPAALFLAASLAMTNVQTRLTTGHEKKH